jgi:hypothetical protein
MLLGVSSAQVADWLATTRSQNKPQVDIDSKLVWRTLKLNHKRTDDEVLGQ